MFVVTTVHLQSVINIRNGWDTWKQKRRGMSHDMLSWYLKFFRGFPFHKYATVRMFCNMSNLLLCFSVFWHCSSWIQVHLPLHSILICVCRFIRKGQSNTHKMLVDGEWTSIHYELCNTPNTIKSTVTAVKHGYTSVLTKGKPHKPGNHSHNVSCPPPPLITTSGHPAHTAVSYIYDTKG
jgi:hypothetical protein